jgi:hypothetical protein
MQKSLKKRKNPLWRKAVILASLPIIVFVWTTGWVLVQIGTHSEAPETKQKQFYTNRAFRTYQNEQQTPDDPNEISHEHEIVA